MTYSSFFHIHNLFPQPFIRLTGQNYFGFPSFSPRFKSPTAKPSWSLRSVFNNLRCHLKCIQRDLFNDEQSSPSVHFVIQTRQKGADACWK